MRFVGENSVVLAEYKETDTPLWNAIQTAEIRLKAAGITICHRLPILPPPEKAACHSLENKRFENKDICGTPPNDETALHSSKDEPFDFSLRSYLDYYVSNRVVLVPCFGAEEDKDARSALEEVFKGREIKQLKVETINCLCGGLNSLFQQVPKLETELAFLCKSVINAMKKRRIDDPDDRTDVPDLFRMPSFKAGVDLLKSGKSEDRKRATELLQHESDKGNTDAMVCLGLCNLNDSFPEDNKDNKKALELFQRASNKGNAKAMVCLGFCYQNGYGVEKNKEKASGMYQKALETGDQSVLQYVNYASATASFSNGLKRPKGTKSFTLHDPVNSATADNPRVRVGFGLDTSSTELNLEGDEK